MLGVLSTGAQRLQLLQRDYVNSGTLFALKVSFGLAGPANCHFDRLAWLAAINLTSARINHRLTRHGRGRIAAMAGGLASYIHNQYKRSQIGFPDSVAKKS